MKKIAVYFHCCFRSLLYFNACHTGTWALIMSNISKDPCRYCSGEALIYSALQRLPQFQGRWYWPAVASGLTTEVPADWIKKFHKDPKTHY